jgi:hypothetical protein
VASFFPFPTSLRIASVSIQARVFGLAGAFPEAVTAGAAALPAVFPAVFASGFFATPALPAVLASGLAFMGSAITAAAFAGVGAALLLEDFAFVGAAAGFAAAFVVPGRLVGFVAAFRAMGGFVGVVLLDGVLDLLLNFSSFAGGFETAFTGAFRGTVTTVLTDGFEMGFTAGFFVTLELAFTATGLLEAAFFKPELLRTAFFGAGCGTVFFEAALLVGGAIFDLTETADFVWLETVGFALLGAAFTVLPLRVVLTGTADFLVGAAAFFAAGFGVGCALLEAAALLDAALTTGFAATFALAFFGARALPGLLAIFTLSDTRITTDGSAQQRKRRITHDKCGWEHITPSRFQIRTVTRFDG